jgi:hypothetical protein
MPHRHRDGGVRVSPMELSCHVRHSRKSQGAVLFCSQLEVWARSALGSYCIFPHHFSTNDPEFFDALIKWEKNHDGNLITFVPC